MSTSLESAPYVPRALVLCFDGTANEYDDTNTNVVKLFALLDKEDERQLVYYQTGVGTYIGGSVISPLARQIAKTADLAVAWYLDAHVVGGYKFLQSNYRKGDRICLFGFSRGAYTARALAGMLYTVGLLPRSMPEQVEFAYRIFKKGRDSAAYKRAFSRAVTIDFIGVWDTVSSVGGIIPRILPFSVDNHITRTFRHAMALDEHRAKFRSNGWHLTINPEEEQIRAQRNKRKASKSMRTHKTLGFVKGNESVEAEVERAENEAKKEDKDHVEKEVSVTDVKEVWFSGCHSDVGGGNTKDSEKHALSNIPLRWMVKEILLANTGIIFLKHKLEELGIDPLIASKRPSHLDSENEKDNRFSGADTLVSRSNGCAEKLHPKDVEETLSPPQAQASPSIPDPSDVSTEAKKSPYYHDAIASIGDELSRQPLWYLLEIMPFVHWRQDENNQWKRAFSMNLARPRGIPDPPPSTNPNSMHNRHKHGVNIPDKTLFHASVKERMSSPEANRRSWRSAWMKKDKPYRPRAWPRRGDPEFVE